MKYSLRECGQISFHIATKEQYFTISARELFHIRRKANISLEKHPILWYNNGRKVEAFEFPFDYNKFVGEKSKYNRNLLVLKINAKNALLSTDKGAFFERCLLVT